jgi:hypothetical protein
MTRKRLLALGALAAAVYTVAAFAVAPGFYDGFAPPQAYRWLKPPPGIQHTGQPQSGSGQLKVASNGQVDPGSVFTNDDQPQAVMSAIAGAFQAPPDRSPVTVTIKPVDSYPATSGLNCVTNVYQVSASSRLVKDVLITLRFSDAVPAPSDIYRAPEGGTSWTKIGNSGAAAPFYISTYSNELGYFAACYPGDAAKTATGVRVGGSQTLPVIVALAILLVVLGGIPLAFIRRRGSNDAGEGDGDSPGRDRGSSG